MLPSDRLEKLSFLSASAFSYPKEEAPSLCPSAAAADGAELAEAGALAGHELVAQVEP